MLNHGLYTDCRWSVSVDFVDPVGAAINLSGAQYVADVVANGAVVFRFRSTGAAANEGIIDLTHADTGNLRFDATETQHASVAAGLYRFHLKRDSTNGIWTAEATLVVGAPGDAEAYLKFDRTVGAAVELPNVVVSGFELGSPNGPAGRFLDLGGPT